MVLDTGSPIVVVNDAGPVRIRSHDPDEGGIVVRHADSWLLSAPTVEIGGESGASVVRVRCTSWTPCSSIVEVSVPHGSTASVTSVDGGVDVGRFDGALTVFAGAPGVVTGPVLGSLRIVSQGPITGHGLQAADAELFAAEGAIEVAFERSPDRLDVVGSDAPIAIDVPNQRFRVEIDSPVDPEVDVRLSETSDRRITIRSTGPVAIMR